jgi:hypothetical protein
MTAQHQKQGYELCFFHQAPTEIYRHEVHITKREYLKMKKQIIEMYKHELYVTYKG